jgi:hypothetical protein
MLISDKGRCLGTGGTRYLSPMSQTYVPDLPKAVV